MIPETKPAVITVLLKSSEKTPTANGKDKSCIKNIPNKIDVIAARIPIIKAS